MDYNLERENNIIKNIATEIVLECLQEKFEVTQELANYMVKLKLLNPKNGFTASEVMPRSLTQQLVLSVVEDLKQDTPAMNCIRMQVYWNSIKMNIADLKKEYVALLADKAEPYLNELLTLDTDDINKVPKLLASYTLISYNLGNLSYLAHLKETTAAVHSIFKGKDAFTFFNLTDEEKTEKIKALAKRTTGIRLYLSYIGKGGEGINEVKDLLNQIEACKEEISTFEAKLLQKIEDIRHVISNVVPMDFFYDNVVTTGEVDLPPECDIKDFKYLKKILVIMLQHTFYISDILSKLEEIDGTANFFLKEYYETLQRLNETIRDREAVPTTEVYDDFERAGELFMEMQTYFYCLESVKEIAKNLEHINKKKYFAQTALEKAYNMQPRLDKKMKSVDSSKTAIRSSSLVLKDTEDFHLEFHGFCAWTLYYVEGFLVPGIPELGIFQYRDQYYSFAEKRFHELWAKDPQYYLMEIYENLRVNPEMIELLNAYENLYNTKSQQLVKKVDRKIPTHSEDTQTVLHPIEEYWDKNYTFSLWELKKQALALSRLVKCVTKSVQTVNPHSHYRASIGLLAAPDKDKEIQTKRDSSCVHSTISNYLYGLRGHREDKFRVIELTRPVHESYENQIILEKADPCRERHRKKPLKYRSHYTDPCSSVTSDAKCDYFDGTSSLNQYNSEF